MASDRLLDDQAAIVIECLGSCVQTRLLVCVSVAIWCCGCRAVLVVVAVYRTTSVAVEPGAVAGPGEEVGAGIGHVVRVTDFGRGPPARAGGSVGYLYCSPLPKRDPLLAQGLCWGGEDPPLARGALLAFGVRYD